MIDHTLRWGILGAAQIARKNWRAIYHSGNSTVAAVASRDVARSRQLIAECQALLPMASPPDAYGSYEELLAAKNVDAVYIPLPTALRKPWVIRAAAAGKHVICEKPCAVSVADLEEMLEACRHHGVQFMDGVMFQHSPRLDAMRKVLDDGASVGVLRRITCAFTMDFDEAFFAKNIRLNGALEPHGCLGDQGWYCIRFILWAANWRAPRGVTGRLIAGIGGPKVPTDFSAELLFDGGLSAAFSCSFSVGMQQWAVVSGSLGQLKVSDFLLPAANSELEFSVSRMNILRQTFGSKVIADTRRFVVAEHGADPPFAQETLMFRAFAEQVRSGTLNKLWPDISLRTQQVLNGCYDSATRS